MDEMTDALIDPISAGIPRLFVLAAIIIFFVGMTAVGIRQLDDERRGMKTFATEAGFAILVTAAIVLCGPLVAMIPGIG